MYRIIVFRIIPLGLFLSISGYLLGQINFESHEKNLIVLLKGIRNADNDSVRNYYSSQLRDEFIYILDVEGSFDYEFKGINEYMSNLVSPDKKVRIFNWNVSYSDYSNTYFAFVQTYDKKSKQNTWYELTDFTNNLDKLENKYLKPEKWLGAIYYEIIPIKKGKKTIYTLLGWKGIDKNTQQKTIDAFSINSGKLRLGAPIFKTDKGTKKRIIIKYSREVKVSLKWRDKEERIVFDHVIPRDPAMKGAYAFYGPDLSFDAFNLVKGKWIFESDVDVRMGKNQKSYNDPRSRKERKRKD